LWWFFDDSKLDFSCREIIKNPNHQILISSASAWEIAAKYRIGKLPEAKQIVEEYPQILTQARFVELKITSAHAIRAGSLPIDHRDPFDRWIAAETLFHGMTLVSPDWPFRDFGCETIW
jgi:PIN domain nuclease of toxin-antitoxin system